MKTQRIAVYSLIAGMAAPIASWVWYSKTYIEGNPDLGIGLLLFSAGGFGLAVASGMIMTAKKLK